MEIAMVDIFLKYFKKRKAYAFCLGNFFIL